MSDYFYNPLKRDLTMVKGDTMSFAFQLQGLGEATRPEGLILTCKETIEDNDPLFEVSLHDTISLRSYDSENDILTYCVRIPPEKTEDLELGRYFYDIELRVNGDVITLMKGRLTLDYEVTSDYTPTPPAPEYEDGDPVKYPIENIVVGKVKLYTEEYISEIGSKIQELLSSEDQYTTQEMSDALDSVNTDIIAIQEALNTVIGYPEGTVIPLSDMSTVIINQVVGYDISIENNIDMFREVKGWKSTDEDLIAWVQYIGDDHFFIYPAKEKIAIQAIFNASGCSRSKGLGLGGMYYHPTSGGEANMPRIGYEETYPYTVSGVPFGYPVMTGLSYSSRYITFDFSNMSVYGGYLSQFYGLNTETTHPLFVAQYSNKRKLSLNAFAQDNYTLDQLVKITAGGAQQGYGYTFDDISEAYIVKRPSSPSVNVVFIFGQETNYPRFNESGKLTNGGSYFWHTGNLIYTAASIPTITTQYSSNFEGFFNSDFDLNDETTFENMIYNTRDIVDNDGNVVIPANISVDTIKSWFNNM